MGAQQSQDLVLPDEQFTGVDNAYPSSLSRRFQPRRYVRGQNTITMVILLCLCNAGL